MISKNQLYKLNSRHIKVPETMSARDRQFISQFFVPFWILHLYLLYRIKIHGSFSYATFKKLKQFSRDYLIKITKFIFFISSGIATWYSHWKFNHIFSNPTRYHFTLFNILLHSKVSVTGYWHLDYLILSLVIRSFDERNQWTICWDCVQGWAWPSMFYLK